MMYMFCYGILHDDDEEWAVVIAELNSRYYSNSSDQEYCNSVLCHCRQTRDRKPVSLEIGRIALDNLMIPFVNSRTTARQGSTNVCRSRNPLTWCNCQIHHQAQCLFAEESRKVLVCTGCRKLTVRSSQSPTLPLLMGEVCPLCTTNPGDLKDIVEVNACLSCSIAMRKYAAEKYLENISLLTIEDANVQSFKRHGSQSYRRRPGKRGRIRYDQHNPEFFEPNPQK